LTQSKVLSEFAEIERIQKEIHSKHLGIRPIQDDFLSSKKKADAFKKQEGVPYEDEEIPECVFFVKETIKVKDFGNLFLSNYKLSFQPNSTKDPSKLAYFVVPYGYIHRVVES